MNSAYTRARQHRDRGFRHHRHVDQYPISFDDASIGECTGKARDLSQQLGIRILTLSRSDRAVVDQGSLLSPTLLHLQIQSVIAGICHAVWKPPIKRGA